MHDQIRTMVEDAAEIGRVEGRIDHQWQAVAMGDIRHCLDVQDFEIGIAEKLGKDKARLGPNRRFELFRLSGIDQRRRDPEPRQRVQEHINGPAIERFGGNNMAALIHQRCDRQKQRRVSAGRRDGADTAFQRSDAFFEDGDGRI